jgi:hypothetical protein
LELEQVLEIVTRRRFGGRYVSIRIVICGLRRQH